MKTRNLLIVITITISLFMGLGMGIKAKALFSKLAVQIEQIDTMASTDR